MEAYSHDPHAFRGIIYAFQLDFLYYIYLSIYIWPLKAHSANTKIQIRKRSIYEVFNLQFILVQHKFIFDVTTDFHRSSFTSSLNVLVDDLPSSP